MNFYNSSSAWRRISFELVVFKVCNRSTVSSQGPRNSWRMQLRVFGTTNQKHGPVRRLNLTCIQVPDTCENAAPPALVPRILQFASSPTSHKSTPEAAGWLTTLGCRQKELQQLHFPSLVPRTTTTPRLSSPPPFRGLPHHICLVTLPPKSRSCGASDNFVSKSFR